MFPPAGCSTLHCLNDALLQVSLRRSRLNITAAKGKIGAKATIDWGTDFNEDQADYRTRLGRSLGQREHKTAGQPVGPFECASSASTCRRRQPVSQTRDWLQSFEAKAVKVVVEVRKVKRFCRAISSRLGGRITSVEELDWVERIVQKLPRQA